jgi:hypothetical protein
VKLKIINRISKRGVADFYMYLSYVLSSDSDLSVIGSEIEGLSDWHQNSGIFLGEGSDPFFEVSLTLWTS